MPSRVKFDGVEFRAVRDLSHLSEGNLAAILERDAPTVDAHWIKQFPEHQKFLGQKLEHHHLDHLHMAYPLPEKLHRGAGNLKIWQE